MSRETDLLKIERKRYKEIIFVLILIIVAIAIVFTVGEIRGKGKIVNNNYPLLDPARAFIPQKNFVINIQPLRNYLISTTKQEGDNISLYYEQLNSGANISINKDIRFYIASLIKLPVAMIAMKKIENGDWNWSTKFKVEPADVDADSGNLYKNVNQTEYTFKELLEALLIDSDNTAQNILSRNFTPDDFDNIVNEIGLEDLFDVKFQGSSKEYSRLLRSLYTSSYLERDSSQKILELMSQSKFSKFLSTGLPTDVKFSHKYGENLDEHIFADSGIVYIPGKPYMLTVLYKGKDGTQESEDKARALMKDISEHAYEMSK